MTSCWTIGGMYRKLVKAETKNICLYTDRLSATTFSEAVFVISRLITVLYCFVLYCIVLHEEGNGTNM